jgi:hypothetical protein
MLDGLRELLARALHSCPPNHRKPHPSNWRLHLEIRCVANLITAATDLARRVQYPAVQLAPELPKARC